MATARYGGDTSAVEVMSSSGRFLFLDAGSGIRTLSDDARGLDRVDVLLTHLHMDHILGLPFFAPLLDPEVEVHIWGPISTTKTLQERLSRYLSPPLFPVRVRDLPSVSFHDMPPGVFEIGSIRITADLVCHPGPTLGYRLEDSGSVVTYLPDHEPALSSSAFPGPPEWTSGYDLAEGADLLIHDSQYTDEEYAQRVGWGHSSYTHLLGFARHTGAKTLTTYHHDPAHSDEMLDGTHQWLRQEAAGIDIVPGMPGVVLDL
ncbi:MAG: MBL fold metallo-hydrolase [Acidimicrobiia bacterium]